MQQGDKSFPLENAPFDNNNLKKRLNIFKAGLQRFKKGIN